jgi:hypothetical protein
MVSPLGIPYGTYISSQRYSLVDGAPVLLYRSAQSAPGTAACTKQHSPNHQEGFYCGQVVSVPLVFYFFILFHFVGVFVDEGGNLAHVANCVAE